MGEELTREELEQEIERVQGEVDELKAELEKVQEQLGEKEAEVPEGTEDGAEVEADEELIALREKEQELFKALTAKQMELVALQKRLNDLIATESMADYGQEG